MILLDAIKCPTCSTYFVPLKHLCVVKDGVIYCRNECIPVPPPAAAEPPKAIEEPKVESMEPNGCAPKEDNIQQTVERTEEGNLL